MKVKAQEVFVITELDEKWGSPSEGIGAFCDVAKGSFGADCVHFRRPYGKKKMQKWKVSWFTLVQSIWGHTITIQAIFFTLTFEWSRCTFSARSFQKSEDAKDGPSTFLLHSLAGCSLGRLNFCTVWEGLSSGFWQTGGRLTLMHLCKQKLLWVRRPVLSLQVSGTSLRGHPRWVSFIISGHTYTKTRGRPIAPKSSLL